MTLSMRSRRPRRSEPGPPSGARTRIAAVLEGELAARAPGAWRPPLHTGPALLAGQALTRGERVAALRRRLAAGTLVPDPARIARALRARQIL